MTGRSERAGLGNAPNGDAPRPPGATRVLMIGDIIGKPGRQVIEHVLPGPLCRTADELLAVLDTLWDGSDEHDERRRRLLAAPPDGRSAARVVAAVTA